MRNQENSRNVLRNENVRSIANLRMRPLAEFPNLDSLKQKFTGRYFHICIRLYNNSNMLLSLPIRVELFRMAAAVMYEETAEGSKKERRRYFREAIKEKFDPNHKIIDWDFHAILLSYFCTYDGALKLVGDSDSPEIGIFIEQNIDSNEDLQILMVPKEIVEINHRLLLTGMPLTALLKY